MIDHASTYTTNYAKSKNFYDKVLAALGYKMLMEMDVSQDPATPMKLCGYGDNKPYLWLVQTKEQSTPRHLALVAPSRESVDEFYKTALEHGGKDNGAPGIRTEYHPGYYAAFVIDPDGNNVEAVIHSV